MIVHFSFTLTRTPLGRVTQQIVTPSQDIAFFLAPLTWKSKKQVAISRSSTEVELRALATTTAEIVWLRWLLADFGISCDAPTSLLCDNTGDIQIANDPVKHELTKDI
jgi:hypothetical protein